MADEHTPLLTSAGEIGEQSENLRKFRKAIGINVALAQDGDVESARLGARGLYKEIIVKQRQRGRLYYLTDVVMYTSLAAQIVIGASLTALGPLSRLHPHSITILGITNTSIAGILALMKGQGLPDRLRKDQFEMRKVQDYIEEMDARLLLAGDTLTLGEVDDAVQKVFLKYNAARDTTEMNRPDTYGQQPEGSLQVRPSSPRPVSLAVDGTVENDDEEDNRGDDRNDDREDNREDNGKANGKDNGKDNKNDNGKDNKKGSGKDNEKGSGKGKALDKK